MLTRAKAPSYLNTKLKKRHNADAGGKCLEVFETPSSREAYQVNSNKSELKCKAVESSEQPGGIPGGFKQRNYVARPAIENMARDSEECIGKLRAAVRHTKCYRTRTYSIAELSRSPSTAEADTK